MQVQSFRQTETSAPEIVRSIVAGATDPMLVLDGEDRVAYANAGAEQLLGRRRDELAGEPVDGLLTGAEEMISTLRGRRFSPPVDTADPGWADAQPRLVRSGRPGIAARVRASTVAAEGEAYVCLSIRAPEHQRQLVRLSGRSEVEGALERPDAVSAPGVVVLDVDHFDLINESLGRAAGNELLDQLTALLQNLCRIGETATHLEADRFALVTPDGFTPIGERTEQVLAGIRDRPFRVRGSIVRITASAGVCRPGPERPASGNESLLLAETALAGAKQDGRDCSRERDATQLDRALATIEGTDRVRTGIEAGALVPHFQPIVEVVSGRVSHYELLARMRSEDGELVEPARFISIAERLGLIGTIDRWAVRTALRTLAGWPASDPRSRIAVNISGRSVGTPQLLEALRDELTRTGIDPGRLIVEMTETAAISSIEAATEFGDELRRLGVGFALDDFGSGFGTFYYLKHLPLNQVKIDGEFIRGIARSAADQVFVKAIVGMAEGLGIETVAEYVTDAPTLACVRGLGIDYAQGFHIGRPGPLAAAQ